MFGKKPRGSRKDRDDNDADRLGESERGEGKKRIRKVIEINECLPNKLAIDFDMLEIELRFITMLSGPFFQCYCCCCCDCNNLCLLRKLRG